MEELDSTNYDGNSLKFISFTRRLSGKRISADGPDGLSMLHYKHFGQRAISYLTSIFNLSVQKAELPAIWKKAPINPVPKPGKDPLLASLKRPISFLCPASKLLERVALPFFVLSLSQTASQHGFCQHHSTSTALLPTASHIAQGFNKRKPPLRTATNAIDIAKAFESVHHSIHLDKAYQTELHQNLLHWLATYLRGHQSRVIWQGAMSTWRIVRRGVPQGSVLGPILFNLYVRDCPVKQPSYADDFTISHSDKDLKEIERRLQLDIDAVEAWALRKELIIAPTKLSITYFTPDRARESKTHPQVTISGTPIPLDKSPKT